MSLLQLAWKNISRNRLRSWIVAFCAFLLAAFALFSTLLLGGVAQSLELAAERMGADIVVVPEGTETEMESAVLMGVPAQSWMPEDNVARLAAIRGVEAAAPQVYLATLVGARCSSAPEMYLIAYEPEADFTVQPWLEQRLPAGLALGEVVGGDYIFATEPDDGIELYGARLKLVGNLEPTGTGLDQSLFFTMETAHRLAESSASAKQPLAIPPGQVSAVLLKTAPGTNTEEIAVEIFRTVPGVYPIQSGNLFRASRLQLESLLNTVAIIVALIWPLAVAVVAMVYLMAANARRRELGVLRALGATRGYILRSLLAEASLLAFCGAAFGVLLAIMAIYLFKAVIINSLGVPFLLPSAGELVLQGGAGLLLAMFSVFLAALFPALKISRQDPAIAMRE